MTNKDKLFLWKRRKYNKKVIAQYLALYTENSHLKKAMVTLTPHDGKLSTTISMRKEFIEKLNNYKTNKKGGDKTIKYYSNIEFNKHFESHLHIQLFYTDITPIQKAFNDIVNLQSGNTSQNKLDIAKCNYLKFTYVIKDYINTNLILERYKQTKKIQFITSSRKKYNNKIVKYLLRTVKFKTKNRYKEILDLIDNNKIKITKDLILEKQSKHTTIKYINQYTVIIYSDKKKSKRSTYKIKRLIKSKKRHRIKCVFKAHCNS